MKMLIDIPEDVYTRLFDNGIQDNEIAVDDVCEMARALRLGTPLDDILNKIREEIEKQEKWLLQAGYTAYNTDIAFDAIKSVLAENEDKE